METLGHVLLAPDKFKGSLTAVKVAARLAAGVRSVRPDAAIVALPVADGGDGTVDAAVAAGFERVDVVASGPTGERVSTSYARKGTTAVVEMATVCGLLRLPDHRPAPLASSSYGLGEVVGDAILGGARRIVIGIGGSASTDGGAGFLQALGVDVRSRDGSPLPRGARDLADVAAVDPSALAVSGIDFVVACDVDNPLVGPNGAAAVYGPQKGADPDQVAGLDAALTRWADVVADAIGVDHRSVPGAGAAGGVGFAAISVLGARLRPGIAEVLDLIGFATKLAGARLVVTGEGALDEQTLAGKAPVGVAAAARAAGVRSVAVCGRNSLAGTALARVGIDAAYALTDIEPDLARCMTDAGPLLERIGATVARDWLK